MLVWYIVAAVAVPLLVWSLVKLFARDNIQRVAQRQESSARLVSLATFVDSNGRMVAVSLALGRTAIYYESAHAQSSLDLEWIEAVDYASHIAGGHPVDDGGVLRLHCFGRTFEFILRREALEQWKGMFPAYRKDEHPVTPPLSAHHVAGESDPHALPHAR